MLLVTLFIDLALLTGMLRLGLMVLLGVAVVWLLVTVYIALALNVPIGTLTLGCALSALLVIELCFPL